MNKLLFFSLLLCISVKSSAQIHKPVKWSYATKITSSTEAILYIRATIAKGWHIYSTTQEDGGPQKTSFQFAVSKDYSLAGKIAEPKPLKTFEATFGVDVRYFEHSVTFTQKVNLNKKDTVIKGKVEFMACTDLQCLPPEEVAFSIAVK